jgi:tRNA dimethylallyltransferase
MVSFPFSYLIIAGPTASGKSAVAIDLAQRFNGEIVNGDSLQVYQDLKILTARPKENEGGVTHHLYGILGFREKATAAWWVKIAAARITDILSRGKLPIVTGGTGLYLNALTKGIAPIPEISAKTQERVQKLLRQSPQLFYDHVVSYDPLSERLHPNDVQRLSRALAVFFQTGQSIFTWHENTTPSLILPHVWCVLEPNRETLYTCINQRFSAMIKQGALEEVEHFQTLKVPPCHMLQKAIGVQELGQYVQGLCSLEKAIDKAQQATRQYAKRQMTWFRNSVQKKIVLYEPNTDTICQQLSVCEDVLC